MSYKLPELPCSYDALEPHIDSRTMEIHHTKHHAGYVKKLNEAIDKSGNLSEKPLEEILQSINATPEETRDAIRNNGGGHMNHSLFWSILTGDYKEPSESLIKKIEENFESFDNFKEEFEKAATTRFGSGWAFLVAKEGKLKILSTPNQDNPIMDGSGDPVMNLDVWEHAYYLNYQNRRPDYIKAFWNIVNWEEVENNINKYIN